MYQSDPSLQLNLFFAFLLGPFVASQAGQVAKTFRAKHRLTGRLIAEHRYHLSLLGVHPDQLERAKAAAETIARLVPPLEVYLDRIAKFGGGAVVLHSYKRNDFLRQFRQELGEALELSGRSSFAPHVTLLYDDHPVAEESVEPVNWVVNKFFLIRSRVGETKHDRLGEWNLSGY